MAGLVGLIVNPVAGAGGRVGLHGTDGPAVLAEAVRRGGSGRSTPRAVRALRRLAESPDSPAVLAAPGAMGTDIAADCGVPVTGLDLRLPADGVTTAEDTRRAARLLAKAGVDLVLFAGGDGTARDVEQAIGTRLPMLGIPAGVKMRSGVFATQPGGCRRSC